MDQTDSLSTVSNSPISVLTDLDDLNWSTLIPVSPVTLVPQRDEQYLSVIHPSSPASLFSPTNDEQVHDINIGTQATIYVAEASDRRMNENKCLDEAQSSSSAVVTKPLKGSGRRKQNLKEQREVGKPNKSTPLWKLDPDCVEPEMKKIVLKAKRSKQQRDKKKNEINEWKQKYFSLKDKHEKVVTEFEQKIQQLHYHYGLDKAEYLQRGAELFDKSFFLME